MKRRHRVLDDFRSHCLASEFPVCPTCQPHAAKIACKIVKDLCVHRSSEAIAASLFTLSESLDVEILAEGVETIEQIRLLVDHGCRFAQGYYRSPASDGVRAAAAGGVQKTGPEAHSSANLEAIGCYSQRDYSNASGRSRKIHRQKGTDKDPSWTSPISRVFIETTLLA